MSHPLIDLTEQEIFNIAYLGLASQGFERSITNLPGVPKCAYTSSDGSKHCAIGWVCAEVEIYPLENSTPVNSDFWEELEVGLPSRERQVFLKDLQYEGHDCWTIPEEVKKGLEEFAENHNLTVPVIPHTSPTPADKPDSPA